MPVNPATSQSFVKGSFSQPDYSTHIATLADAFLKGYQQKKQAQDDFKQKAFLSMASALASQGQISPGETDVGNGFMFPGTITPPPVNYAQQNQILQGKKLQYDLEHPNEISGGTATQVFFNTKAGMDAWKNNEKPEAVAQKIRAVQDAWNKQTADAANGKIYKRKPIAGQDYNPTVEKLLFNKDTNEYMVVTR